MISLIDMFFDARDDSEILTDLVLEYTRRLTLELKEKDSDDKIELGYFYQKEGYDYCNLKFISKRNLVERMDFMIDIGHL